MNVNTITAYLLVSNTDAVDLKQQLRSYEDSKDLKKVISLLSEEWYVHERLKKLYDYALLGVSPDKCVYHFGNIRSGECFDVYLNNYNGNGKDCTFGYVDSRSVTQDAENSDEAIRNYSIS